MHVGHGLEHALHVLNDRSLSAVRWKEKDNYEFWPTPGQLKLDVEHAKARLEWQMHTRARLPERRAQRKPCNSVDVRADRVDGLQTPAEDRSSPRSIQLDLAEISLSRGALAADPGGLVEDADNPLSGERYGLSLEATMREFGQSMLSAAIRWTLSTIGRQSKVRRSAVEIVGSC